jgi:hypothetical protein
MLCMRTRSADLLQDLAETPEAVGGAALAPRGALVPHQETRACPEAAVAERTRAGFPGAKGGRRRGASSPLATTAEDATPSGARLHHVMRLGDGGAAADPR